MGLLPVDCHIVSKLVNTLTQIISFFFSEYVHVELLTNCMTKYAFSNILILQTVNTHQSNKYVYNLHDASMFLLPVHTG